MAKSVQSAIKALRQRQDNLAHGTLKMAPKTLEEVYRACGEYAALEMAVKELQEIQTEADGDET